MVIGAVSVAMENDGDLVTIESGSRRADDEVIVGHRKPGRAQ
jgi:hypothetical protein